MRRIVHVRTARQIESARGLFREYADSLGFDLCFQDFWQELASLPGKYAPPEGALLLARCGGRAVGCVAMRKLDRGVCEMKRLYVCPGFRGRGIGRALAEAIVAEARKAGYETMRLDTVPALKEAIALYESMGFRRIGPYRPNPIPGATFMEVDLGRNSP